MAGDWIKMRVNLVSHPKVLKLADRLLSDGHYLQWSALSFSLGGFPPVEEEDRDADRHAALRITRYVCVTALLRFWGYANEHAKGEHIQSLTHADVDEVAGVPGFGVALAAVGWAEFDPAGGVTLTGFAQHNTSAEVRKSGSAERQKAYRERLKLKQLQSDVTRDVTSQPREEKRREEKKDKKGAITVAHLVAEGIPEQAAADWLKTRGAALTPTSWAALIREAGKAHMTPAQAVTHAAENSWRGFKAEWVKSAPTADRFAGAI